MGILTRAAGWAASLAPVLTFTGCGLIGAESAELTEERD